MNNTTIRENTIIDLSQIPSTNKVIHWNQSVGKDIRFICNDIEGVFHIIDYSVNCLTIKYLDNKFTIRPAELKQGLVQKKIGITHENQAHLLWKYNIGQKIKDDKRNLIITNRKMEYDSKRKLYLQYYQYECFDCGFKCGEHYKNQINYNEYWSPYDSLKVGSGCACCRGNKIVAPGINDIPTTAPWMIPYFQGGEDEARMYCAKSGQKIYPICPDCGHVKDKSVEVKSIYRTKSIGCICSDNISYPNKFSYAFLNQLLVLNWQPEYSPDWLKPYRYDNYFEYQGQKYVLEMDGGFHDIDINDMVNNSKNKNKIRIKQADKIKDDLAKKHDIKVIRVDCNESNMDYIKNNIINSALSNIFDLNNIDWDRCDEFACKNIAKEVSLFWGNNNCPSYTIIKNNFYIKKATIKKYLTIGAKHGWCSYYNGIYTEKSKKKHPCL